jgi:hypothetical protein
MLCIIGMHGPPPSCNLAAGASSVITLNLNTTAFMFPDQFNLATVSNASDVHALNNTTGDETAASTPTTLTYSGDVGFFLAPVTGTTSTLLSSSACSINTAGATVANTSGNLVLTVPIVSKAPMVRTNKLFQRTLDVLNRDTGFQQTGTWTVN